VTAFPPNSGRGYVRYGLTSEQQDLNNIYNVIRFSIQTGSSPYSPRVFDVSGDHLFIAEDSLNLAVYVRLGATRNPWIRVRAGDTLRRRFSRVAFRYSDEGGFSGSFSGRNQVIAYASYGPLVDRRDNTPIRGLRSTFNGWNGLLATTTPQTLGEILRPVVFSGLARTLSYGKVGGLLILRNTDAANTLLVLGPNNNFAANNGFPIRPTDPPLQLDLASMMEWVIDSSAPTFAGIKLASNVGTCAFGALVSPWEQDRTEEPETPDPLD
jgi:hypothetical protein